MKYEFSLEKLKLLAYEKKAMYFLPKHTRKELFKNGI